MKGGVLLIIAALAMYLAAVGCALFPANNDAATTKGSTSSTVDSEPAPPLSAANLEGMPYRGIVLQVARIDDISDYEKAIDQIVGMGADTVEIVVDSKQENGSSEVIFLDQRQTPSQDKLIQLLQYAKGKGLRVVMMPIVLLEAPRDTEWRGQIKPDSWDVWFKSYRSMEEHYASAAAMANVDVYVVGSELVTTETEDLRGEWVDTIHDLRRIYHGLLTYSANWDHYRNVRFWDQLDLICTNSYWKLGENRDVSVEEIVSRWRKIQADLLPWIRSQHKPYMLTEVGWCSLANAAHEPWDYTQESVPVDLDLQKKLYEGFFQAWNGAPELGGYMIWAWTPNGGGPNDRSYTPAGKPAEQVLRAALRVPRWKVRVGS